MATFRVGQRVRIVGAGTSKFLIGQETTITALYVEGIDSDLSTFIGHRTTAINFFGKKFIGKPSDFEPIQDDGRKVISWDAMKDLWQPNHESAPA